MCLTIPLKVLSIEARSADSPVTNVVVKGQGGAKKIRALDADLRPGDWVLCAYDVAVKKISPADAAEILALLEPKAVIDVSKLNPDFLRALKSHASVALTKGAIVELLRARGPLELETLLGEANTVRQIHQKDFFCIHGIIEFSNHCVRDCFYCGLRKGSLDVERYRMTAKEIVDAVGRAVNERGYKLIVLQSGDDFHYTDAELSKIITDIKKRHRVFIFVSVGERSIECYEKLKAAGASGALIRFESSNADLYGAIHPGQSLAARLKLIRGIKRLGYYLATGFLVGLPGQTDEIMAEDLILTKELGANMISIGPFIPCQSTPLANYPAGSGETALKATAISRLLMPKAKIPVTTALETLKGKEGRRLGLSSGANSLMFNLTPAKYRANYRIYPDKYHGDEEVWERYGLFKEALSYRMLEKKMFEEFEK